MLTGNDSTLREWITGPTRWAGANRVVVDDLTLRVQSTSTQTRVLAFRVDTGMHRGALGACHALRPALWWNTHVARETRANRHVTHTTTLAVGAAW